MTVVLAADGVTKSFGTKRAVDAVTMDVREGEVVGLLGANGAGKTTLIRLFLGLATPSAGSVHLFGEIPTRSTRARLGYVPQHLGLYEDLTVGENLQFISDVYGLDRPASFDEEPDRLIRELSLGTRRRLAFAAAMSHQPELLVLDEPTSGVGPLGRARLWESIIAARSAGVGVLVSTHHMAEADQCDRVVVMSQGEVIAQGTTNELSKETRCYEVLGEDRRSVSRAIAAAGLRSSPGGGVVRVVGSTLDEISVVLSRAEIEATVRQVTATFDETFVSLATRQR